MKRKKLVRLTLRTTLVVGLMVLLFAAIAFLPGSIEGSYQGRMVSTCGCDGRSFINLRHNRIVTYFTAHPPAWLTGRYEKRLDGGFDMFMQNLRADEPEKLFMKAYPRLLITKFVGQSDGEVYWCWKWPLFGVTKEAYKTQEISSMILERDGSMKRIIYDKEFRLIRREVKTGRNQWAEQDAPNSPPPGSLSR